MECLLLLVFRLLFPLQFAEKMGNAVSLRIGEVIRFSGIGVIGQPLQAGCSRVVGNRPVPQPVDELRLRRRRDVEHTGFSSFRIFPYFS